MNESTLPALRTAPGAIQSAPTPLAATQLQLTIVDLLATLVLEQRYVNREQQPIEVSYTFALPLDATLLDVSVEIAGRRLRGQVQARVQAEMRYEEALAQGHSAYSIRMLDDQLVNIALGNLLPGESLLLRIECAQWLNWNGDRVRLSLPTTIAPRYGNPRLQPADLPVTDLLAEHGFSLRGSVRGLLAQAELASPSHRLSRRAVAAGLDFAIERGLMDRDVVIDLRDSAQSWRIAGAIDRDLNGRVAAQISLCTQPAPAPARTVIAELVIDCSGSMGGVSMEQTRVAVQAIIAALGSADRVNLLRFGSSHHWLLRRPQPATVAVQRTLLDAADGLNADLGGTELLPALEAGLDDLARVPAELQGDRVLFVISDGEVWNLDTTRFIERCQRESVRFFAVAVGTAAVEATFAPLTRGTGGALERVLPGDAMAARIQRHFERVRSGALRQLSVRWPGQCHWQQGPSEAYPGDGVRLSAVLDQVASDASADLHWLDPDGTPRQRRVALSTAAGVTGQVEGASGLARMLAGQRIRHCSDATQATTWGVDYQLVTPHTAITLVLERSANERAGQLPELRTVAHMLAAGWGGTASRGLDRLAGAMPAPACAPPPSPAPQAIADDSFCLDCIEFSPIPEAPERGLDLDGQAPPAAPKAVATKAARAIAETRAALNVRPTIPALALNWIALARLLVARLQQQPELANALREGQIGLSQLQLTLSTELFNWLDARAEAQGLDLEQGEFWRALCFELSLRPEGSEFTRWYAGGSN